MCRPNVEIKKGKGIEGLFEGFAAGKPEEEKKIEVVEGVFQGLMERYERILEMKYAERKNQLDKITDILTPAEINTFLQMTIRHEQHEEYCLTTREIISELIQKSYDAGHNDFMLDTTALKEIYYIGSNLEGTEERPIEITITGNTGDWCGCLSKHLTYKITGNTGGECGYGSKNSTFEISGNTGEGCGKYSTFSTYKTPNRKTLQKMLKDVPKGNRIVFIHPDGSEEVMRDYDDS